MKYCIICDKPNRQTWNVDYCSPACTIAGEIKLDIIASTQVQP